MKPIDWAGWKPGFFTVYEMIHKEEKSARGKKKNGGEGKESEKRAYTLASLNIYKGILLIGQIV